MTSLVAKSGFGFVRTFSLGSHHFQGGRAISNLAIRWSSTQAFGSPPSQLPVPGEPGWSGFIANMKRYHHQAPLSPEELQRGQEVYKLEQRLVQIESRIESMCSTILKSNESLKGDVKHLIQILHHD